MADEEAEKIGAASADGTAVDLENKMARGGCGGGERGSSGGGRTDETTTEGTGMGVSGIGFDRAV